MAYFNILQKKWHSITYLKGFKNAYLSPKLQRALRGARALEPVFDSLGAAPLHWNQKQLHWNQKQRQWSLDQLQLSLEKGPVESGEGSSGAWNSYIGTSGSSSGAQISCSGACSSSIPHICHFWYTTAFFRPVKSPPKKYVNSRQKLLRDKTA